MKKNTWKFFLITTSLALVGAVFFGMVITFLNPYFDTVELDKINIFNLTLFYISLFLFFAGLSITTLFYFRVKRLNGNNIYFYASTSFRQGILLGVFICLLFLIQSLGILIWWDALLLMGAMILVEMYLAVR